LIQLQFNPFPILTSERLLLRQLAASDQNEIYIIRTDSELNQYVNKPETKSLEDVQQFIEKINNGIANNESIYWVISMKETRQFAGTICLWNIDKGTLKAETGYTLLPEYQGKGIMYEALNEVIKFGFQKMNLESIEAYTHRDNNSSFQLLDRCHFRRSDKEPVHDDKDLIIYYLDKQTNFLSS